MDKSYQIVRNIVQGVKTRLPSCRGSFQLWLSSDLYVRCVEMGYEPDIETNSSRALA